jgi:hypothetical protein
MNEYMEMGTSESNGAKEQLMASLETNGADAFEFQKGRLVFRLSASDNELMPYCRSTYCRCSW